jgi:hypothetical protein
MAKIQKGKNWIDEFEENFYFIRGGVDLVRGCFLHDGSMDVDNESVVVILDEAKHRLDKMRTLIDRVNDSRIDPKILKRIQKMRAL